MSTPDDSRWLRVVLTIGFVYLVAGLVFAELAKSASSNEARTAWRLAAWVISAAAFAAHIGYEHLRLNASPRTTALHAAAAVALAALGLAVAANVHGLRVGSSHQTALMISLVAWPVLLAIPSFIAAFTATTILTLLRRGPSTSTKT